MLIALTFAAALVVVLVVTPVVRGLAHRLELLDLPGDYRKVHQFPVPRLGGVAMVIAFAAGIAVATMVTGDLNAGELVPNRAPAILAGLAVLVIFGILDDVSGMPALIKVAVQVGAALVAAGMGLTIDRLHLPTGVLELGPLALPLTVAWFVAVINAVNLIDGLDGLASGVVLTVLGAFAIVAAGNGVDPTGYIIAATAGGAIGFLAYNLHPASIIMGDTGSMFLGFVVAALGIAVTQDGSEPMPPWVPMIALGVPILDTMWAIVRRTARGDAFYLADRGHIHHTLLRFGFSQRDAMLALTAVSAAFAMLAAVLGRVSA